MGSPSQGGKAETDQDDRQLQAFRPIRLRKAADEVVAVLINSLVGGLYQPGDLLPRTRDLANQLEVSRTVVQEAIERLRQAGVLTVRRGNSGGALVSSLDNLPRILTDLHGETQTTLQAILEARRPLELAAGTNVAVRATDDELAYLRSLVDPLADLLQQPEQFMNQDARFHFALGELSHSAILGEMLRMVTERLLVALTRFPVGRIHNLAHAYELQVGTMQALETRNPNLVAANLDIHLGALEKQFLGHPLPLRVSSDEAEAPCRETRPKPNGAASECAPRRRASASRAPASRRKDPPAGV
jgi:GntR family transcriptional repressor for pyruvate dehydrogenase complex